MASVVAGTPRQAGMREGIAVTVCCALPLIASVALTPVLPKMMEHFKDVPNYRYWVPFITLVPALCVGLLSWFVGMLADIFGRRTLLLPALIVYAIFGIAPMFLDNLFVILATRVGLGLAETVIMVVCTTLIGDYFKGKDRAKWLSNWTAGASISVLGCVVVGGYLGNYGWRAPFVLYLLSLVCFVGIWFFTFEPQADVEEQTQKVSWSGFPFAAIIGIAAFTGFYAMLTTIITLAGSISLTEIGVHNPGTIGLITAFITVAAIISALLYRSFSQLAVSGLLAMQYFLMGCGFILMSYSPNAGAYIAAAWLTRTGSGMTLPTLTNWAMRYLPYHHRSRGMGIYHSGFNIGQACTPFLMTYLQIHWFGGRMISVFQVVGVAALLICISALAYYVTHGRQQALLAAAPAE